MAGIRHTTPADGTFTTEGASAWNGDEAHTLSDVASQTDLNALSNAVSVLSNTNSSEHAGLSNRITSVAGLAGGGSVTSAEVQAVSAAAQSAINTVSNALSVLSNTNSSEHAALSARITSVAGLGGGSVTSAEVQAVSAAAQSAVNTVSNAVSVVSQALSVETAARIAAVNTVSNSLSVEIADRISAVNVVSNALSVLSNANSASHVSIDGRVTSVANAVSVLSQALSALSNANSAAHVSIDGRVTSVANAVSVVSNALSVLSQTNSVDHAALSNRITSVAGLGGGGSVTSAEVNAVSVAAQSAINTVSNALSVLSQTNSSEHAALSSRITSVAGLGGGGSVTSAEVNAVSVAAQSAINTVSNALSVLSQTNSVEHAALSSRITSVAGLGGGGSVTSQELSVAAAGLSVRIDSAVTANANNASVASNAASVALAAQHVASNYASVTSNYASVVSNYASVISATALLLQVPQVRIVSNTQSTAGSALVDISGLVLTVAADQTWEVQGMIAFSTSATTVGLRMGYSVPPLSTPRFGIFNRASGGQSAGFAGGAGQLQVSGQSIFMSITGAGPAGGVYVVDFKHVMNVASAGTVRLMYAGIASTTASPIHLMPGSYLKAIRLK